MTQPQGYGPSGQGMPAYQPPNQGPENHGAQNHGPYGYGPQQYRPPYPPPGFRPVPPPLSPGGQPLADFGTRLLAYLIDAAVLTGVALVLTVPLFLVFFGMSLSRTDSSPSAGYVITVILGYVGYLLLLLGAYYVYHVELMYRSGQTIGKKVMKVRVVPIQPGATLTRGMAAKRYGVQFIVGMLVPVFTYVDGFWQLWDKPYLQTLHDKAAQTVVVKVAA